MSDQVYLINSDNPELAGFYDAAEAAVYLAHSVGWSKSKPPAPKPPAVDERSTTVDLVNDLNPAGDGQYDRATADVLLAHSTGWREASAATASATPRRHRRPATPRPPARRPAPTPPAGDPPTGTGTSGDSADNEGK